MAFQLDYLDFKSENTSRFLFNHNSDRIKRLQTNFLTRTIEIFNEFPNSKLLRIEDNYFGQIRGEIVSIMKCERKEMKVVKQRGRCTEELEVMNFDGEIMFLSPGTRLLTREFTICDCEQEAFGNIFIGQNKEKKQAGRL